MLVRNIHVIETCHVLSHLISEKLVAVFVVATWSGSNLILAMHRLRSFVLLCQLLLLKLVSSWCGALASDLARIHTIVMAPQQQDSLPLVVLPFIVTHLITSHTLSSTQPHFASSVATYIINSAIRLQCAMLKTIFTNLQHVIFLRMIRQFLLQLRISANSVGLEWEFIAALKTSLFTLITPKYLYHTHSPVFNQFSLHNEYKYLFSNGARWLLTCAT